MPANSGRGKALRLLKVRVIPKSKREGGEREGDLLVVKVKDPPVSGKANRRLIEVLSDYLGIPKSKIEVVRGQRSREKIIKVDE